MAGQFVHRPFEEAAPAINMKVLQVDLIECRALVPQSGNRKRENNRSSFKREVWLENQEVRRIEWILLHQNKLQNACKE